MSGTFASTGTVVATTDPRIDGILGEEKWATNFLTYNFPTTGSIFDSDYGRGEANGFFAVSAAVQNMTALVLDATNGSAAPKGFAVSGFTALEILPTPDLYGDIRVNQTTLDPFGYGTAWAYYPSTSAEGGDVWLSSVRFNYSDPVAGNYANLTLLHELGHALGLEHSQDDGTFGKVPAEYDAMEFTVMSYRAYPGSPTFGYFNETWGYAQSYMMLDIAALQHLYGANYSINSDDTVYSWNPASGDTLVNGGVGIDAGANRIFATIWDGGGTDTYDLSQYQTALSIDLAPGASSVFSDTQIAQLASGHLASGNIYNALLHKNDARSLIENAIGGSGNDTLQGNQADNVLQGNDGNDLLMGMDGEDSLFGGNGIDKLYGHADNDHLSGDSARDRLRGGAGDDTLDGGKGKDLLFGDNGHDVLNGNNGIDTLIGGKGRDVLTGGRDADIFIFKDTRDSQVGKNSDTITDFESGIDRIDLSNLSDTALTFETGNAFSGTGGSIYTLYNNNKVRVMIDADGDGTIDMRIFVQGITTDLKDTDFLL